MSQLMDKEASTRRDPDLDRDLDELLQEIRVILPGAEVLFAFLFTLPFSARFEEVTPLQSLIYFVALVFTALATVMLIAPSAHRRLLINQNRKAQTLRIANYLTIAGTGLLAVATTSVLYIIGEMLYGNPVAAAVTAVVAGAFGWLWYGWPFVYRRRSSAAEAQGREPVQDGPGRSRPRPG